MKVIIRKRVYTVGNPIKPIGHTKVDGTGNSVICPNCNKGRLFIEIGTGDERCTNCNYPN